MGPILLKADTKRRIVGLLRVTVKRAVGVDKPRVGRFADCPRVPRTGPFESAIYSSVESTAENAAELKNE